MDAASVTTARTVMRPAHPGAALELTPFLAAGSGLHSGS